MEKRQSEAATQDYSFGFRAMILAYLLIALVGSAIFPAGANAHEYWLQVDQKGIKRGDTIEIRARVGQDVAGIEQIYSSRAIRGFRAVHDGEVFDVETRDGDRPIGKLSKAKNGLYVAALMTNANVLTYQKLEKFQAFATSHGNDFAIAEHAARNLPDDGFKESYFRFAKTLIKVGDGAGKDIATGMPYELVALTNPFTEPGSVRFLLTHSGRPVPDHHVDVFFLPDGAAKGTKTVLKTNALGEVSFPTEQGFYMVNAVRLEHPNDRIVEALGVVWQSLWASSTFRID